MLTFLYDKALSHQLPLMEKMLSSSQIHLSSVAVNISALGWWGQSGTTFELQSISWHKSEPFLFKNLLLSTIFFPRCLIAKFNSPISSASRSFFGNYFIPKVLMLQSLVEKILGGYFSVNVNPFKPKPPQFITTSDSSALYKLFSTFSSRGKQSSS